MTRSLMAQFGAQTSWEDQTLLVPGDGYQGGSYTIESDWSAASYWYSFAALATEADIFLEGLREQSWQGDQAIARMMEPFGVRTRYEEDGLRLTKGPAIEPGGDPLEIDFVDTPDLAQTVAVVSAATGIPVRMSGLHTLRIKETDRIHALQEELAKFGVEMDASDHVCTVRGKAKPATEPIHTYEDHRMAMAFAPMVLKQSRLQLEDESVVEKSYPEFWDHLREAGITGKEGKR
jgi:3-phosphoshikimate 1-carboxyvinyltransferase